MTMDRRQFLSTTTASLAAALADEKPKRVGVIGCGWYGKCDLFRLIQVAPVEVVCTARADMPAVGNSHGGSLESREPSRRE